MNIEMRNPAELKPHRMLSRVTMVPEVVTALRLEASRGSAGHDRDKLRALADEKEAEWKAFVESVAKNGLIEPLKILDNDTVVDGRHRLRAAQAAGLGHVPVIVVDEVMVGEIILSSMIARRHLGSGAAAYLAVLMTPEAIDEDLAHDRRVSRLKRGTESPLCSLHNGEEDLVGPTGIELARRTGVSQRYIAYAVKLARYLAENEIDRAATEAKIWAGISLPAIVGGHQGKTKVDPEEMTLKQGAEYKGSRTAWKAWRDVFKGVREASGAWEKMTEEHRGLALQAAEAAAEAVPPEIREAMERKWRAGS
jgi:ParB-like chromosome segregation protein Spo0J